MNAFTATILLGFAVALGGCRDLAGNGETKAHVEAPSGGEAAVPGTYLSGIVDVEADDWRVCALAENGSVYCWGYGDPGVEIPTTRPTIVPDLPPAKQIGVLQQSAMAVSVSGEVFAWGLMTPCYHETKGRPPHEGYRREPFDPELDVASAIERHPEDVSAFGDSKLTQTRITRRAVTTRLRTSSRAVFVGDNDACVFDDEQRISCCGLASDVVPDWETWDAKPVPGIVDICADDSRMACVLFADGHIECFDRIPLVAERRAGEHQPLSLPAAARSLVCGGNFVALLSDGRVARWSEERRVEIRGNLPPAIAVDHYSGVTCVLTEDREVWCRYERDLSNPFPAAGAEAPWQVQGLKDPRDVAVGGGFACALQGDGSVACWGPNQERWGEGIAFERKVATPHLIPAPLTTED